jgi:drug/metabolite transporter (DMT)-like permease
MGMCVFSWGYEYVAAKAALEAFTPLALVCLKYGLGAVILLIVKLVIDRRFLFNKKDIPVLIGCSLVGEILYYTFEYSALSYLPVSVITIVLAFVPAVSVISEYLLYKQKPNFIIIIGIAVAIVGVGFVIGADFTSLFSGSGIGYILAFGAVFAWNIYNFCTDKLANDYKALDLTLYQSICTVLMSLPFLIHNSSAFMKITPDILVGLLYLGLISTSIGFIIYVNAIEKLGPTPCAIYSNMLPITSTFFGWLFLKETILPIQILGGCIVIISGFLVIWQKGKLDENK